MSGICGIALQGNRGRLNPSHLLAMIRALDATAEKVDCSVNLGSVGLGTQKLLGRLAGVAEVDSNGRPLALAFYGNLYNWKELFPSSEGDSTLFSAFLGLYMQSGMTFLQKLRGDFVLALWDGQQESLYLATDRFRVNPLFYYQDQDKLVFSSRMKGILACPLPINRSIDLEAVVDVLEWSTIPTPKSIFCEVKKLPPGYILTYHKGEIRLAPYWEINFLPSARTGRSRLVRALKTCLTDAVSVQLGTDESLDRVGTFLSGGIDSSAITGILTQLAKGPIKSFSIGFDDQRFNELNYARITAQSFGTEHHEYLVTPQDTLDAIPILIDAFDEPFANASAVPTYFCAKMAREHGVHVLFAGDGGDELFAGNERYADQRLFEYYQRIPRWIREPIVKPLVFLLADKLRSKFFTKGKKYIQRASIPYPDRLWSYGFFKGVSMSELLDDGMLQAVGKNYDPYRPMRNYYHQAPASTELDRQLYIDLKLTISDNDVIKVVRMTEAAGVAVRFPFLDHPLAEFSATVPARIKMRGRTLRSFFKEAYSDLLPLKTRTKKKHGFGLPITLWLRNDKKLNDMMHDLVLSPKSVQRGYFSRKALEHLVEHHRTDRTLFYGAIIWNLMILELWHRRYMN